MVKEFGITPRQREPRQGLQGDQICVLEYQAAPAVRRQFASCCGIQEGGGRDLARVGAVEMQRILERVGK